MNRLEKMNTPRHLRRSVVFAMLAAFAAICLQAGLSVASIFEYDLRGYNGANLTCGLPSMDQMSDTEPVSGSVSQQVNDTVGNSTGTYEAISGRGIVGMRMAVNHRVNSGFNRLFGGCSEVRQVIDDIVVSGPAGLVTAELNAELNGTLDVDSLSTRSDLRITVGLTALDGGGVVRDESFTTIEVDYSESVDLSQALSSGPITFQVGDILEAELLIEMSLVAGELPGGIPNVNEFDLMDEESGFGLHFSESNVLTLPAGYTSSSEDGEIGENQWQGTVPVQHQTWGNLKSIYR